MNRRRHRWSVRLALTGAITLSAFGANAAAPQDFARPQVGIPGCPDDVPVRAWRQLVQFESRGREIRGYLYSPGTEPSGAAMVLLHGGTGFEMNAILFDAHAIQLASRGHWVLLPAYFDAARASSTQRTITARAWRQVALDAVRELRSQPGVDPGRVVLWGYSRGGGVALDAVTSADSPSRSVILVGSGGRPETDLEDRAVSALVIHARRDEAVPPRTTIRSAEALRQAGASVEIVQLDFDGHRYDLPTWCTVMTRSRLFLDATDRPPAAEPLQ